MPDLSNPYRGGPSDAGVDAANSSAITITAHATVNTKGSWVELISSTTHETTWMMVTLMDGSSAGSHHRVDIGVGASTSEVVLIPDLHHLAAVLVQPIPRVYIFPVAIPKGTRVSARCQSNTTVVTIKVSIQCFSGPITAQHGLRRCEAAGLIAASNITTVADPGATPNTDGAWTELIAATLFSWRWMCVASACTDTTTAALLGHLADVGVGAGGAEVVVVNDLWFLAHTGTDNPVPGTYCFPCAIAAGQRVSVRSRCSVGTAGDRVLKFVAYGVG